MTYFLVFLLIAFLYFVSPVFRIFIKNPHYSSFYSVIDIFYYFKHKEYNRLFTGELVAFCGLFGRGKTLSAVHKVVNIYNQYNNKPIWDSSKNKFITQKIVVLSNVQLSSIPFIEFESLQQIVDFSDKVRVVDQERDTLTCLIVLGDEFSVQLNSRSFKTNIDPLFLNTLLTCRHHHISIYYTSQRFAHVDALLRQVTSYVVQCEKVWRFQVHKFYDAWDLENASSPSLVQPYRLGGFFVRNKDFNNYDTLACVNNLSKAMKNGDMLSEAEILSLQNINIDNDNIVKASKKFKKMKKTS